MSCQVGTTFSMPITETSTPRQSQAHPAIAFRLDDADGAGFGDAEIRPADRHRRAQKLLPQVRPGRGGKRAGLVGQAFGVLEPAAEQLADLRAVLVDRRHEDVRRPLAGKLDDQLGQVGLDRLDAGPAQRLVEADLVGGQRLDLDHLLRSVARDDPGDDLVGFGGVARPVHLAPGAGDGGFQLQEIGLEVAQGPVLDRPAGLAQQFPVGQLLHHLRPLGPDRLGGHAHIVAKLVVAQGEPRRVLELHGRRGRQRFDVARHQFGIGRRNLVAQECALPSAGGVAPAVC